MAEVARAEGEPEDAIADFKANPLGITNPTFACQLASRARDRMELKALKTERIEQAKADWRAGRMKLPDRDQEEFIPLPEDPAAPPNPMS